MRLLQGDAARIEPALAGGFRGAREDVCQRLDNAVLDCKFLSLALTNNDVLDVLGLQKERVLAIA